MEPDGLYTQGPKSSSTQTSREGTSLRRRLRNWWSLARVELGLRRLPEGTRADYVAPVATRAAEEEDPEAVRRMLPYALSGLGFAVLAALIFWVYGLLTAQSTPGAAISAQDYVLRSLDRVAAGDLAGAQALRDEAHHRFPRTVQIYMLDGYLLSADRQAGPTQATDLLEKMKAGRANVRQLVTLAGYGLSVGQTDTALKALEIAARHSPRSSELGLVHASAYLIAGKTQEALDEANHLEELMGPSAPPYDVRGRAYMQMGRPDLARPQLAAAVQYSPATAHLRLALADALTQLGDARGALTQINDVLTYYPNSADAYVGMAILQDKHGSSDEAEKALREALKINPNHVKALNNLAYLLAVTRNRPADALPFAERAVRLAPNVPQVLDTLGYVYTLLGRNKEALPLLEKAATLLPDNPDVKDHLSRTKAALVP